MLLRVMTIGVALVGTCIAVSAAGVIHAPGGSLTGQRDAEAAQIGGASAAGASTEALRKALPTATSTALPTATPTAPSAARARVAGLAGVGAAMAKRIPKNATQAIVVRGAGRDAATDTVTRWQRANPSGPWHQVGAAVPGRNGASGWSANHREGDLRSPIGVYTLTNAAGRLPNPGSGLPYDYGPEHYVNTGSFMGQPLAGSFDYLVDINYNHIPGTPPSDLTRPFGQAAGGDIYLHVDHGAPTHGCVSIPRGVIVSVIRWLDPEAHPVIVMGDATALAAA
jgi:L,D-peptidoglycan transpeptidase YkuD (ErfK/YbiS/YcfS/YnhG family)